MYRLPPHYDIKMGEQPSTVMYACENYHKGLDACFGDSSHLSSTQTAQSKPLSNDVSIVPKHDGKQKPSAPHTVSDFEARQLAVLSQLQQLGTRLDKLGGKSDNKKRTGAQAKDVKRQKTESSSQELLDDDPPVPDTIVLSEQPNFAFYQTKAILEKQFPLNIFVSYTTPPPFSLLVLASVLRQRAAPTLRVGIKGFLHSGLTDVNNEKLKSKLQQDFVNVANDGADISQCQYMINFVWQKDAHPKGPVLLYGSCLESRTATIVGELAIAKYLGILAGFFPSIGLAPEGNFLSLDYWLYTADGLAKPAYPEVGPNVVKEMGNVLAKRRFLIGDRISFADVMMWSVFYQSRISLRRSSVVTLSPNVKNWFLTLNSVKEFQAARALIN